MRQRFQQSQNILRALALLAGPKRRRWPLALALVLGIAVASMEARPLMAQDGDKTETNANSNTDRGNDRGSLRDNNDRGSLRDREQSSTRGASTGSNTRRDRNSRSNSSRSNSKQPANAAASATGAAGEKAPAGAAGRGVQNRAQSRAITGSATAGIASRAPGTSIVFNYKVPTGLPTLYFDPPDLVMTEGQKEKTVLKCGNPQGLVCDRLHLGLRYNPAAMRLVGLDARPLQPFFRQEPIIRRWR
jgi:hypothetical protein